MYPTLLRSYKRPSLVGLCRLSSVVASAQHKRMDAVLKDAASTSTAALAHLHDTLSTKRADRWVEPPDKKPRTREAPLRPAIDVVKGAVPKWLLERSEAPLGLRSVQSIDGGEVVELHIDGAFRAMVQLHEDGEVPLRLAICDSHEAMPLDASQPAASHALRDVSARGQRCLALLDALPAANRLPLLSRWLCSYHDLFSAPCAHCGRFLWTGAASDAAALLPPTVRDAKGRAYHAHCFSLMSMSADAEEGWLAADAPRGAADAAVS